ncbi:RagB/SusD family nutrient uptake outer membrane protein [Chryseolinea lacunae]|uniref:RagB/SusD family nutrient uptake outer membrane protein n=1 Tax=Chryseolinea lacunae TaxID=2801331 RepID=A0ABS1L0P7_9BACT|nr:RagB/SusD family nutrient uptake outer membrane protein [Chryseolinea lacunae]MBL0745276.1 RagB/SusD family nutrient uptake outer membrane protein [Chryseolinea lacunae]
MKKLSILLLALLPLASCDVLNVESQSAVEEEQAIKDKTGIEKGILGAYTSFQALSYYGRSYLIFSDLAADNLDHPADATALEYAQIDNDVILPENGSVDGMWSSAYEGINIANNIIAKVPDMADMTPAEKNAALGELYFIRALNHFNLLNYWGSVPVKTSPTIGTSGLDVPRDPVAKVYEQIIADLTFAEANLGAGSTKVRASKDAATALLARVNLYKGDYAQAKAKATAVIESENYDLIAYADVFADGSDESIFEIDFTDLNRNRIAEYNFPKTLNGRREVAPSPTLLTAYEVGDARYPVSVAFAGALPYANKYNDLSVGADNVIVLRLAEMYLIRAEAEAKLQGDVDAIRQDINAVRTRAKLPDTNLSSYDGLLNFIEKERRVEFAFEGHRWFDLVRTNRAVDVLPNVNNVNQTLFPIPLTEIVTNQNPGMKQNPGY